MPRITQSVQIMALFFFSGTASFAHAGIPMSERMAVEKGIHVDCQGLRPTGICMGKTITCGRLLHEAPEAHSRTVTHILPL